MKATMTIEIDLTSSTGDPMQLDAKLREIVSNITNSVENIRYDSDNEIVYNNWEDPHPCECLISLKVDFE